EGAYSARRRNTRGRRVHRRRLPRTDAYSRTGVREAPPPHTRDPAEVPASVERPRLLGRLRPRADHVPRSADHEDRSAWSRSHLLEPADADATVHLYPRSRTRVHARVLRI